MKMRHFSPATSSCLDGRALKSEGPSTSYRIHVRKDLNSLREKSSLKRKHLAIPEKIRKEIAHCFLFNSLF